MVRVTITSDSSASISGAVARRHLLSAGVRVPLYLRDNVSCKFDLLFIIIIETIRYIYFNSNAFAFRPIVLTLENKPLHEESFVLRF